MPMYPELNEDHEALRALVREFATAEIEPHAAAWDRTHEFPLDAVRKMGELGLFGIPFPESVGGGGGDFTAVCVAIEELARVDQSIAITVEAGVGLGANPIFKFGTAEQQQRWLPDLCAGRALGAFGLTEPDAGSDAGGTRTRAAFDDTTDEWVIDGEKAFITNSGTPITSIVTITALTGPGEISSVIVPSGSAGMEVQPPYRKMGWHASDTHGLTFVECRVPADHLLGERGRGIAQFLEILDEGRVAIAALAVGVIQRCVDDAVAYAGERTAFGRPIGSNQGVAFRCADMQMALAAARASSRTTPPGCATTASRSRPRRRPPSCSPPRRRSTPHGRPRRCSAATASSTRRPCRATTATPRSSRSARGRARCSAS